MPSKSPSDGDKHREKERKRCREYYRENREELNRLSREYYAENREAIRQRQREYYQKNKEKIKAKQAEYRSRYGKIIHRRRHEKIMSDPHKRIVKNLRSRISVIIRGAKRKRTMELIGCDREHFLRHLEVQFKKGMTWDNYGETWVVDHHIPVAAHDHSKPKEVEACWHFSNLKPMFKKDNLRKGEKICLER